MFGEICDDPMLSFSQGRRFSQRRSHSCCLLCSFRPPLLPLQVKDLINAKRWIKLFFFVFRRRESRMFVREVGGGGEEGSGGKAASAKHNRCSAADVRFQLQSGVKQKDLTVIYTQHSSSSSLTPLLLLSPLISSILLCFPHPVMFLSPLFSFCFLSSFSFSSLISSSFSPLISFIPFPPFFPFTVLFSCLFSCLLSPLLPSSRFLLLLSFLFHLFFSLPSLTSPSFPLSPVFSFPSPTLHLSPFTFFIFLGLSFFSSSSPHF